MKTNNKIVWSAAVLAVAASPLFGQGTLEPVSYGNENVQKIRFVEDDAQNYMVSKIYELKHQKANDLVPFLLGAIKRYAKNGTADRINYKAGNKQFISVTCPAPFMPYVDDMIEKLDRPGVKGSDGSGIDGTGIIRNVYRPQYRTGDTLVNVMVKAGISSNASDGANQDAIVALDKETGMIYWKDSFNKDKDLAKYLAWLDRSVPQCALSMQVYEVRESDLLDLGIDYLAWKNGPGLNLFEGGMKLLEGSALTNTFGPYGFFAFAPSFDLSFLRMLQQNGKARVATSSNLTLTTGHDGSIQFNPDYQNLTKDDSFKSAVSNSGNNQLSLDVKSPVITIAKESSVINFKYDLTMKNVVERNNHGDELVDETTSSSTITVKNGNEKLLTHWSSEQDVEQSIGVPFLCELPVLKYIFGTTTRTKEKYMYFLTVKMEMVQPDTEISSISGRLVSVPELVK